MVINDDMNSISPVSLRPPYQPSPWGELLVTAVNAGCLWWFTWMQFLMVWFFGVPAWTFHLSSIWALEHYKPLELVPLSLPELFMVLSLALAALCLFFTIRAVWRRPGGVQMILVVSFFAGILCWFSGTVLSWRIAHVEQLEGMIRYFDTAEERWFEPDEWTIDREVYQNIIDWHRHDMGLE
jgi:hypothetical protein